MYIYVYIYISYIVLLTHTHVHIAHTSCWEKSQKGFYAMLSQTKEGSTSLGSTYWVYIIGLNYFQVKTRRKKMNLKCLLTVSLCFEKVHQLKALRHFLLVSILFLSLCLRFYPIKFNVHFGYHYIQSYSQW